MFWRPDACVLFLKEFSTLFGGNICQNEIIKRTCLSLSVSATTASDKPHALTGG